MAYTVMTRIWVFAVVLVCISRFCCNLGKADEGVTYAGSGVEDVPHTGVVGDNPAEIAAKALLCFNDNYIYTSCKETYRLNESGKLSVPAEGVDHYCSGPCLAETHLVLNCIHGIMINFEFYNKATIEDVSDTINAGCGNGPERGNFDVSKHIQAEKSSASKIATQSLFGISFIIVGFIAWRYDCLL